MAITIRKLAVRPRHSADLSFAVPGVVEGSSSLGERLAPQHNGAPFTFEQHVLPLLNGHDNQAKGVDGTGDVLTGLLASKTAAHLFNHPVQATLRQIVAQRRKSLLELYKNMTARQASVAAHVADRGERLREQYDAAKSLLEVLVNAYEDENNLPPDGLQRKNLLWLEKSRVDSENGYRTHAIGSTTESKAISTKTEEHKTTVEMTGAPTQTLTTAAVMTKPVDHAGAALPDPYNSQTTTTNYQDGKAGYGTQDALRYFPEARHPILETKSRYHYQLGELATSRLAHDLYELRVPDLVEIWKAELESLNLEVRKAQLGLLATYLPVPFPGRVVAVFKGPGEFVNPGDPVLRLEVEGELFLPGKVKATPTLRVGQALELHAQNPLSPGHALNIHCTIVRCTMTEQTTSNLAEYDIVLACSNPRDANGRPILPLDFIFLESTTLG